MAKYTKIALIFLALVITTAAAFYFLQSRTAEVEVPRNQVMTEEMQLQLDREALKNSNSTPNQIYGAMIRLAQKNEDVARNEALKRSSDTNPFLRGGAAQTLGHFDDADSKEALKKLLIDNEKSVRLFAIQGLGTKPDSLHEQELQQLLKSSELDPMMEVEIYTSLLKSGGDSAKQQALTNLLRIARAGDDEANTEASQRLITYVPDNDQVLDLVRRKISAGKNERVTAVGTRYLSARNDSWIRPILKSLSSHPSATVRSAVVQSIHRVCPADRWAILESMLAKEADSSVLKLILEEPMYLMGEKAKAFASKAASKDGLSADDKKIAEETLEKVEAGGSEELCEQQQAKPADKKQ